jgi:lipopolysaccharide export system protein LptA
MQINRVDEEYITHLSGNVHFFYGDIEFTADRAFIYEKQQIVNLRGNVRAIQDTLSIASIEADYIHADQHLKLTGNVVIEEKKDDVVIRRATSNIAHHFREKGEFNLSGNVRAHAIADSLFATAGYGFYDQISGYGYFIQNPVVWKTGADSLALYAQKIEFYEPIEKVVASFNVITQNADIVAKCDFLIYYGQESKIVYIGNPSFTTAESDGRAELITIFLDGEDIREIHMTDDCYINFQTSDALPKDSWISSTNMTLFYVDNKPSEFLAEHDVKSFFRHLGKTNASEMNNNVVGDFLKIYFDDVQKVSEIRIDQNIRGVYRFQRK